VEARRLYSDADKLTRPVTAALAVTTRTASFARPDVAERTLPILTAEFADAARLADSDLLASIDAHRDGLLSWAAITAAALLAERHHAPAGLPLRFVDFARLTWAYMRAQGRPELAAPMLLSLRRAQALTVGDADPLTEAIVTGFDAIADDSGAWLGSASELVGALSAKGADIPFMGGAKRIANALREAGPTLELMGITMRELGRGQRQRTLFHLSRCADTQSTQSTQSGKLAHTEKTTCIEDVEGSQDCVLCVDCVQPVAGIPLGKAQIDRTALQEGLDAGLSRQAAAERARVTPEQDADDVRREAALFFSGGGDNGRNRHT
jgi:hypothetical protein